MRGIIDTDMVSPENNLYRLPPPPPKKKKKKKKNDNRTFSINNFRNCELTWICFRIIKKIICISAKTPSDLVQ